MKVGWKSLSFKPARSVIKLGKIANNLQVGLKFETDNVRQRSCVGETVPTVARPTLTHQEEKEADTYGRQNKQTR
jgi:hypothetical protein